MALMIGATPRGPGVRLATGTIRIVVGIESAFAGTVSTTVPPTAPAAVTEPPAAPMTLVTASGTSAAIVGVSGRVAARTLTLRAVATQSLVFEVWAWAPAVAHATSQ